MGSSNVSAKEANVPAHSPVLAAKRYRCRQIPAFCDDVQWPVLEWEMLYDTQGEPLSGESQAGSWFYTPDDRQGMYYRHGGAGDEILCYTS